MNALPFRPDQKLTEVLAKQKFTISAEVIPPRNGSEQGKVLHQIEALIQAGAQFLAVTKGAGGSLRGGSLPIAQAIKERFSTPCIAHFTCRDLNAFDVENQLMDHHYFGIRNILALRGDPPDGQPQWHAREGGYNYAYELIAQIKGLNAGNYMSRPGGPAPEGLEKTDFCIGAAVYPDYPNEDDRLKFFRLKVEAGAEFGITDMLFDPESYGRFLELCYKHHLNVPILAGTRFLKTRPQALRMAAKFKVKIPDATLQALPEVDGPDAIHRGLDVFMKLADRLESLGAPGLHLYVIADTLGAAQALKMLAVKDHRGRKQLELPY
jgi:methylenetetrahydrofolate reductase (NADPH)